MGSGYTCVVDEKEIDCQVTIPLQFILPIEFFNRIIFIVYVWEKLEMVTLIRMCLERNKWRG